MGGCIIPCTFLCIFFSLNSKKCQGNIQLIIMSFKKELDLDPRARAGVSFRFVLFVLFIFFVLNLYKCDVANSVVYAD